MILRVNSCSITRSRKKWKGDGWEKVGTRLACVWLGILGCTYKFTRRALYVCSLLNPAQSAAALLVNASLEPESEEDYYQAVHLTILYLLISKRFPAIMLIATLIRSSHETTSTRMCFVVPAVLA